MDKNSRNKTNRKGPDAPRVDAHTSPGGDALPHHAADLINRAFFEEWLHKYGSWDAFLDSASKAKKKDPADDDGPQAH